MIDSVIESVCFGLEQNDFRFLQRRIAEVKYLSELYNYRMLEHPVIFDVMYRIVTLGHGTSPGRMLLTMLLTSFRRTTGSWPVRRS